MGSKQDGIVTANAGSFGSTGFIPGPEQQGSGHVGLALKSRESFGGDSLSGLKTAFT